MKPATTAIAAIGVVVAGAFVLLVLRVQASPSYQLSAEEQADADARHRRLATRTAPPPRPASRPPARRTSRPDPPENKPAAPEVERKVARGDSPLANAVRSRTVAGVRRTPRLASPGDAKNSLRERMQEARKLYDSQLYPEAKVMALEVLEIAPKNVRMLRVVVSAACLTGEADEARDFIDRLPRRDQLQMRRKCSKYGIEL